MGGGKGSKSEVAEYYMSIHYGISAGPVDNLLALYFGEKLGWSGQLTSHTSLLISKNELFGGVKKEGGVNGTVEFLPGNDTQVMPPIAAARLGLTSANCPAYRGISSLFFHGGVSRGFYWIANNPYMKGVWAKVSRTPKGLNPALARIYRDLDEYDANPSHMIYECLTNTDWGMGAPSSEVNITSFLSAAQTLYDEGLGLSMLWTEQTTIEDFVTGIINHIDGSLFVNPRTGLWELVLVRGDYDVATLPVISPDNATLENYQQKLWGETINEVTVSWTNPESEKSETVTVQDPANIAMQGAPNPDSRSYPGVRTRALAMQLAMRDLRVASYPLATCDATVNREGWDIFPGSVVLVNWPEHEIESVPFRVGPVDYGRTTDSAIKLALVEDVFGSPQGDFIVPPGTSWEGGEEQPAPLTWSLLFSAPHYLIQNSGQDTSNLAEPNGVPVVLGAQTGKDTLRFLASYEAANAAGVSTIIDGSQLNTTARGVLVTAIPFAATSTIERPSVSQGLGPIVGGLAILGTTDANMEICVVTGVNDVTVTLRRGTLDTVPKVWPAGTPIWFTDEDELISTAEVFPPDTPASYRARSVTSLGTLDYDDASDIVGTIARRAWLPSRPANVRIGGVTNGTIDASGAATLDVTWVRRNRLMEDSVVLSWTDGDVTPEDGQTVSVQGWTSDRSSMIFEENGLTGTSYSIPIARFGSAASAIVKVVSKRGSYTSLQGHEFPITL